MENKTNGPKLKKIKWKRIALIITTIAIITVGSVGVYFAWNIYEDTADFTVEKLLSGEASKIYDQNGTLIYTYGSDENGKRVNIEYDDLPQVLVDAVVAAEDSRFFEHDGFDLPRIAKAFITNLAALRITGGGSTITQQVIKKSYFSDSDKTYTRKLSEVFLAMEATKEVSKEDILTMYLNKIYFGRSLASIGVSAASKYYFNKDVSNLTLPEAALLAGALNQPYTYDPYYNLDLATQRRNTVLGLMLDHGYITQDECDDAKKIPVENTLSQNTESNSHSFQAYIDLVTTEVKKETDLDPSVVQMDIYTYMDTDVQKYIENLANEGYEFPNETMQVGAAIQSTKDGRIIGVVGGRNYANFGTNRSTIKRQPGSSLKPITAYGASFEYLHWSTAHQVEDKAYNKVPNYNPTNYDGTVGRYGKMLIPEALYHSWNTTALWTFDAVVEKTGFDEILDLYENLGVDMKSDKEAGIGPSFTLGGWSGGTSPIEMASIYATVANDGEHIKSHTIDRVEIKKTGEVLSIDEEIQKNANQAFSAETAFMIRDVQGQQITKGPSYSVLNFGQIRAKTGTTNYERDSKFKGAAKDSWLAAYNPDYAVSVWMGYDEKDANEHLLVLKSNEMLIAREFAAEIFHKLADDGVKNSFSSKPSGIVEGQAVKGIYPYKAPSANTPADMVASGYFWKDNLPDGEVEDMGINDLSSFSASLNSDGKISVNFGAYDPAEAVTNPNFNEATKMYGCVRYGVDVKNENGEVIQSFTHDSPSFTLDFIPTSDVTVEGYYMYANASGVRSNVIPVKITSNSDLGNIQYSLTYNGSPVDGSIPSNGGKVVLNLQVTRQNSNSIVIVTLYTSSGVFLYDYKFEANVSSCDIKLDNPGAYKIVIDESYNGKTAPTATTTVTVT